jgi:hypothetical protein
MNKILAAAAIGLMLAGCMSGTPTTSQSPAPGASTAPAAANFDVKFKALAGSGTGTGSVMLSPDMKSVTVSATASGLTGAPTMAHIHMADTPGGNGGVVKNLTLNGNTASATWTMTDADQPLTAALLQALKDGKLYFAFHTQANPAGELRGDIMMK